MIRNGDARLNNMTNFNDVCTELSTMCNLVNPMLKIANDTQYINPNKVNSVGNLFSFYLGNGDVECVIFITKEHMVEFDIFHTFLGNDNLFNVYLIFDNDDVVIDRSTYKLIAQHATLIKRLKRIIS